MTLCVYVRDPRKKMNWKRCLQNVIEITRKLLDDMLYNLKKYHIQAVKQF